MRPAGEAGGAALRGVGEERVRRRHARRRRAPAGPHRRRHATATSSPSSPQGDVIAVVTAVDGARSASPAVLAPVIEAPDARLR
ncbi:hypothetical protein [Streptomyces tuirus]|uniref:hypothetical protein n=1 Tax=Streptomyces tuirus TaxID=68278 RepID=UPI001684E60C|nr:hypothetical protein [Streptomyces tuirus]